MSKVLPVLIGATGLSEFDLRRIILNAPLRYKSFYIPKRNGGRRKISQPARELKALQRALVESFLADLPIHECATAYRKNLSIADNAGRHAGNGPILKYDFREFFPSIRVRDWRAYCERSSLFEEEHDRWMTEQILFQRDKGSTVLKLSIGAPSSPMVSNILMYEFDAAMTATVARDKVRYTRYADDLTFSAPRTGHLTVVDTALRKVLRDIPWPRLAINEEKTVLATRKYRRQVTGLILTNEGEVSLGRERKRSIRASLHYAQLGKLSDKELSYVCGMLGFVQSVEPDYLKRLEDRYGLELLRYVRQFASVTRRD